MSWARQDHPWRWTTCDANWMLQMRKFLLWCQCVQLDTAKWQLSVLHSIPQDQAEKAGSLHFKTCSIFQQPDSAWSWTLDGRWTVSEVSCTASPSNLPTFQPLRPCSGAAKCFALGPGGTFCADLERTPTKHRPVRPSGIHVWSCRVCMYNINR